VADQLKDQASGPKCPTDLCTSFQTFTRKPYLGLISINSAQITPTDTECETCQQEITMNARRILITIGSLVLAVSPLASYASSKQAIDACVKSFVETYVPKDRVVRIHKSQPTRGPLGILSDGKDTYTVALFARGARTGQQIAHARCVASTHGLVIVMDSPADDTYVATADFAAVVDR
jgi:hypothetical protein